LELIELSNERINPHLPSIPFSIFMFGYIGRIAVTDKSFIKMKIIYIDIQWFGQGLGNRYWITRDGKKEKTTFSEVWQILQNPANEKIKTEAYYSHSHYKILVP
jgi:hypothetical protein